MSSLEIRDLETGYGRLPVLHGVSIRVEPNELVAIVGPNGAGKTSMVKALFGLLPAMKGSLVFDGVDITGAPTARRNEIGMAMVPQTGNTFPDLTVEENLSVSFSMLDRDAATKALQRAYDMFPQLDERRKQPAKTLSGGERQMLAFASGIGTDPRLLVLDEPTTGLAPTIVQGLVDKIVEFRSGGASILWIIEENPLEVLPVVDRVYVLNNGAVQAEMPAAELLADDALQDLFFGVER
ncbi:MAG: ABC transporter ATP-binding protein [Acidimicrobiia bacterium]|nr:ABC transporter ATP-binding protein [Acidimicrobiia bacterium]MDH4307216.1 ABC transporter ATP-binding protein [Acidimicrobiia bacterium]MDH5292837.1 ABC transporter ATP-binding protein [Acidimicrobiia bacterium]